MKRLFKYICIPVLFAGMFASCHKISVPVTTELTPSIFPQDTNQFIQASGPAYVALRGNFATEYFFQQAYSTDEGIMEARGGNWFDGSQNKDMHYHNWTKDNPYVNSNWNWLATIIGTVNQSVSVLKQAEPEGAYKQTNLAELKMVRDLAYFMMMDNYGNVPLDTVYGDFTPHTNVPRAQVFTWLENDIKSLIPFLNTNVTTYTYGRPTVYCAYALLAKMYLNAEYYTGTARYNDCVAACDNVISSGKFNLASIANYLVMFYPTNGPTSPGSKDEFIFAIPFDATSTGFLGRSANYKARYDVPRSMGSVPAGAGYNVFSIPYDPGGPASTLPEYYANFSDPNDIRNKQWLTGLQYRLDGVTPVMVTTTNLGYDQTYTGPSPSAPYTYQVNLTPNIILRQSVPAFDAGNDEIAWNMGYRNIKFFPDATSLSRNQNNDIPVFRYSDIILMKAEAIQRGGTATNGATALSLINQLKAVRTTTAPLTSVTLDSIYAERCREFAWEGWHRNDMIRFGKYEGTWGFKTDKDPNHRIFPIPTAAFQVNQALVQNPGY